MTIASVAPAPAPVPTSAVAAAADAAAGADAAATPSASSASSVFEQPTNHLRWRLSSTNIATLPPLNHTSNTSTNTATTTTLTNKAAPASFAAYATAPSSAPDFAPSSASASSSSSSSSSTSAPSSALTHAHGATNSPPPPQLSRPSSSPSSAWTTTMANHITPATAATASTATTEATATSTVVTSAGSITYAPLPSRAAAYQTTSSSPDAPSLSRPISLAPTLSRPISLAPLSTNHVTVTPIARPVTDARRSSPRNSAIPSSSSFLSCCCFRLCSSAGTSSSSRHRISSVHPSTAAPSSSSTIAPTTASSSRPRSRFGAMKNGALGESLSDLQDIDRELIESYERDRRVMKCLLLGAGECGKSTILKQMRILHSDGYRTPAERRSFVSLIQRNTLDSIVTLCDACIQLGVPFDTPDNHSIALQILSFYPAVKPMLGAAASISALCLPILPLIKQLWNDSGVQRAYARQNEFHLLESAAYFLNATDRVFQADYDPTVADILRSRVSTTGIVETTFQVDQLVFKMYDVGGQRGERKKWIHCFDNVTAILFVTSLSEYDQVLAEDRTRNRMQESLDLFEGINNLPWFRDIPIILFLNKDDIFREKIKTVDIGIYFPEYHGGCDYEQGLRFIQDAFSLRNFNPNKNIYIHVTDATNTQNIEFVWRASKHIILEMSLHKSGMLL